MDDLGANSVGATWRLSPRAPRARQTRSQNERDGETAREPGGLQGRVRAAMGIIPGILLALGPLVAGVALQDEGVAVSFIGLAIVAAVLALVATFNQAVREAR